MERPTSRSGLRNPFRVESEFLVRYPIQQAAGKTILELWVPAEELDDFNAHLVGPIEVVHEFRRAVLRRRYRGSTRWRRRCWIRRLRHRGEDQVARHTVVEVVPDLPEVAALAAIRRGVSVLVDDGRHAWRLARGRRKRIRRRWAGGVDECGHGRGLGHGHPIWRRRSIGR